MANQKGFSSIIVLAVLVLLGLGFYAGITSQKSLVASVSELLPTPQPSVSPSIEPTPTDTPKITPKQSPMVSVATPAPQPTTTPLSTPTPTQSSANTSDSNSPTFIKISSPNGGESFKVGDTMHIIWSSNNLKKNGSCIITLAYDNGSKSSTWVPVNTPNGFFDWKLTSESGGRQVKVDMDCYDSNSNNAHDQSDNFFTVTN